MTRIQQVNDSLGGELEANFNSKCHAKGHQQQVLAQAILLRAYEVLSYDFELFGDVYLLQGHADLQDRDDDEDQALSDALLRRDEGGALGPPVALKFGVHPAVNPVQHAVYVISGHIPLLVLEKIRTRWNKRRHTDLLAKHEQQDFPVVVGLLAER